MSLRRSDVAERREILETHSSDCFIFFYLRTWRCSSRSRQGAGIHSTVSAFSVVRTLCAPGSSVRVFLESGTPCAHPPAARPSDRGRSGWREGGACRGPHRPKREPSCHQQCQLHFFLADNGAKRKTAHCSTLSQALAAASKVGGGECCSLTAKPDSG